MAMFVDENVLVPGLGHGDWPRSGWLGCKPSSSSLVSNLGAFHNYMLLMRWGMKLGGWETLVSSLGACHGYRLLVGWGWSWVDEKCWCPVGSLPRLQAPSGVGDEVGWMRTLVSNLGAYHIYMLLVRWGMKFSGWETMVANLGAYHNYMLLVGWWMNLGGWETMVSSLGACHGHILLVGWGMKLGGWEMWVLLYNKVRLPIYKHITP